MQQGTWSHDEHDRFLAGLKIHPDGPWRLIAGYVGTRSVRQVQTHAQKYHEKIARRMRGLRKERRNHIRKEHRIDGDVLLTLQLESPAVTDYHQYSLTSFDDLHAATAFQLSVVDDRTDVGAHWMRPSIHLPPLRLTMPSLTVDERDELLDEPTFEFFARSNAYDLVV